jgi:hypothetical protein
MTITIDSINAALEAAKSVYRVENYRCWSDTQTKFVCMPKTGTPKRYEYATIYLRSLEVLPVADLVEMCLCHE